MLDIAVPECKRKYKLRQHVPLLRFFLLMTLITLPLDQWAKEYSRANFLVHEDDHDTTIYQGRREEFVAISISGAWFTGQLTYVRNHGASWGVFHDLSREVRLPGLILSGLLLVVTILLAASRFFKSGYQKSALGITALVAGSVGNFVDRVRLGYVVDFLSLRCGWDAKTWILPSFNIADIIIVLSLIFTIHRLLFEKNHKTAKTVT